jgi:hypothetical protein
MASSPMSDWLARDTARRRAAKLLSEQPLIRGSIVSTQLTCGNPGCRCTTEGKKHPAHYLAVRHEGKRRMFCIPKNLLAMVTRCVKNHQLLEETLDIISRDALDVFFAQKRR